MPTNPSPGQPANLQDASNKFIRWFSCGLLILVLAAVVLAAPHFPLVGASTGATVAFDVPAPCPVSTQDVDSQIIRWINRVLLILGGAGLILMVLPQLIKLIAEVKDAFAAL